MNVAKRLTIIDGLNVSCRLKLMRSFVAHGHLNLKYRSFSSGKDNEGDGTQRNGQKRFNYQFDPEKKPLTKAAARMREIMARKQKKEADSDLSRHKNEANEEDDGLFESGTSTLLYRRDSTKRFPQHLMGFTIAHTSYWIWYMTDFATVATSVDFQFSQQIGALGFGFSVLMLMASSMYPPHLINEITLDKGGKSQQQILVKVHSLPFCSAEEGGTVYPRGELMLGNEADRMKVEQYGGKLNSDGGHLAISASDRKFFLLLDVSNAEVMDEERLSKVLLGKKLQKNHNR